MQVLHNNRSGFSYLEILFVLLIIGILAALSRGRGPFGALVPGAPQHAFFPIIADRLTPSFCENDAMDVPIKYCFRFGAQGCEKMARAVIINCLNEHKSAIPPILTQAEEQLLLQMSGPCMQKDWVRKLQSIEMDLRDKRCAAAFDALNQPRRYRGRH